MDAVYETDRRPADSEHPRIDDGRRKMPKLFCPYCNRRVIDSRTVELRRLIRLVPLSVGNSDFYMVCPRCGKTIGIIVSALHESDAPCVASL